MILDDKGYSESQVQALIDHAKDILSISGESVHPKADLVYSALEDYCWHVPHCENGDRCVSGEEGTQERRHREKCEACQRTRAECVCDEG